MTLKIRLSIADILLVEEIIRKYMEENNIKDINKIYLQKHEILIQNKYNEATKDLINE